MFFYTELRVEEIIFVVVFYFLEVNCVCLMASYRDILGLTSGNVVFTLSTFGIVSSRKYLQKFHLGDSSTNFISRFLQKLHLELLQESLLGIPIEIPSEVFSYNSFRKFLIHPATTLVDYPRNTIWKLFRKFLLEIPRRIPSRDSSRSSFKGFLKELHLRISVDSSRLIYGYLLRSSSGIPS